MKRPRIALSLLLAVVAMLLSAMDAPSSRAGVADARGFLRSGPVCTSSVVSNDPIIAPYLIGDHLGCYLCGLPSELTPAQHALASSSVAQQAIKSANASSASFEDLTPSDAVVVVPAETTLPDDGPSLPQLAPGEAGIAVGACETSDDVGGCVTALCSGYIAALCPGSGRSESSNPAVDEEQTASANSEVIVSDLTWLLADQRIERGGIDVLLLNWRHDGLLGFAGPVITPEPAAAEVAREVADRVISPTSDVYDPSAPSATDMQRQLVAKIALAVREDRERQAAEHARQQAALARAMRPWVEAAATLLRGVSTALDDVSVALTEIETETSDRADSETAAGESRTASRAASNDDVEPNVYHGL